MPSGICEHATQIRCRLWSTVASNRRSWIGFNSPDRLPSQLRRNACLLLVCDVYFYVNSCRRDGADKKNVISQKSAAGLRWTWSLSTMRLRHRLGAVAGMTTTWLRYMWTKLNKLHAEQLYSTQLLYIRRLKCMSYKINLNQLKFKLYFFLVNIHVKGQTQAKQ